MKLNKAAKAAFGGLGGALMLSAAIAVPCFAAEGVTTMATTAPLNMRAGADINANVMSVIPQGTSVQVFGMTQSGWYDVEYGNERGHCWYQYLNFEGSAEGTVHDGHVTDMYATAPLNVRAQPSTDAAILGSFPAGEAVSTISVEGDWCKVKFRDGIGYCHIDYLK